MKQFVPLIAVVALAACSAEEPAMEEEAVEEEVVESVAPPAGTYETVYEDGSVVTVVVGEDGSISQTTEDGETLTAMFVPGEEGQRCIDMGEDGIQCGTESEVAEDGSWTVTGDDGVTFTVRPVAEETSEE